MTTPSSNAVRPADIVASGRRPSPDPCGAGADDRLRSAKAKRTASLGSRPTEAEEPVGPPCSPGVY